MNNDLRWPQIKCRVLTGDGRHLLDAPTSTVDFLPLFFPFHQLLAYYWCQTG